ncbi:MAG: choice-of-anchor L domain-containing protein, partial [Flavobacteriales bacterium]|nr:choice-of-anchor L domain-containing protein [Flavobacteriales bacterium]
MKRLILLALTVLSSNLLSAQLLVTPGVGGAGISGSLVGPGLTVSGPVTINCSANAYGTFSNGLTTNLGVSNGIIMTTGSATTAIGPNNSGSDGICNGTSASDAQLLALDPLADQDVCVIGFDIIPQCNQLTIKFVFGSEEYPEWVSSGYNDAFGFFVTGPNPGGGNYSNFNIARLPNNSIVSIDNVNATTNNTYYVNNTGGTTIEYDGFTTVLTPVLNVTPCQTYHFKLAIADAGDCYYDSGVFIDILSCTNNVTATASATNPSCGLSNGSATVSTSSGIGPFSYSWNTSPVQTTQTATGLAPGTYTVTVTDLGAPCGTPATASVTLTNTGGGQPTTSVSPSSTTICQGSSVNLTASGATTYSWSPSTGLSATTGATVTATPSSTITYTVTGTNSCGSVTATTTVTVTPTPNVTATPSSQSICSGSATNIALSGTVPGTTYSWTVTQS